MNPSRYHETAAPPGADLAGLACVWSQELPRSADGPFDQRVVPDGCVDLIWWSREGTVQVAGPDTGPAFERLRPGDRLIGVRFRPGMAAPALGVPVDAVQNERPPLSELWGGEAERLGDTLARAADPQAALVSAVLGRSAATAPADPIVGPLVARLARGSVREAADALGFSDRQLRRRTTAAFGYGPKTLQRVLRFQRALDLARAGRPLADVAHETDYTDQAHLAHDVRELAGVPITALLAS